MIIEWETLEHPPRERSSNWYWLVGAFALILVVGAIVMKNFLLAILVLLGTFTLIIVTARAPRKIRIAVSRRGIQIHNNLFPYHTLRSFWLHEDEVERRIIIQSEKLLMPHIHLPLGAEVDHESLRLFLLDFLPEEPHRPTIVDLLAEYL
ncbi:MAG: hypothetical protein AAB415_02320 [Patescibacteria group bacterium]